MTIELLNNKVKDLYEEYKDDDVILNKLINYITTELPTILINTKKLLKSREDRKLLLKEGHDKFVNQFINKNIYFYCNTSEIFFKYDNEYYNIIKEDDIIHSILTTLSQRDNQKQLEYFEEQVLPWKFKIKTSIIKQIRDLSIFSSIPESITIQKVINLFQSLFNTKNETKYFLTILGDTILKKPNNIYIINPNAKIFLRTLENLGGKYFGHIPLENPFRYKYYDHNYNDCRLLNFKNYSDENYEHFHKIIIDIYVVCCYHSNRYNSADDFLYNNEDNNLKERALFLKNNSQEEIVNKFIEAKLQTSDAATITSKNMLYLWKCYLEEINIPNIIFITTLKSLLKNKLEYNELEDIFYGYTSLGLPLVSSFVKFWEETIKEDINEYYLEIDEICILFKQWNGKNLVIKENTLINLIKHFYSDIIIENKYIYGISSTLWNKKEEIIKFLKAKYEELDNNISVISLYELYVDYCKKYCKKNKNILIISKTYFDLFITNYFRKFIDQDNMLNFSTITSSNFIY